jgi:hypothetical protein
MTKFAVAILLLALTMPASAEDYEQRKFHSIRMQGNPWHADVGARALRRIY